MSLHVWSSTYVRRLIQVHKSIRVSNKWWKATEESSHVRFDVSVACAGTRMEVEGVNKKAEVTAITCVCKTAYSSCQPSTICFLYQLPAPVKTLKCTQSPSASLGRVEFFNFRNSVARWLSLFSFLAISLGEPFDAVQRATLFSHDESFARIGNTASSHEKPRRWHCLVILVATLRRFEYERSDKSNASTITRTTVR